MEKAYQMNAAPDTAAATGGKLAALWAIVYAGMAGWDWSTIAAISATLYSVYLFVRIVVMDIRKILARRKGGAK